MSNNSFFKLNTKNNYLGVKQLVYYDYELLNGINMQLTQVSKQIAALVGCHCISTKLCRCMPLKILITNPRFYDWYDRSNLLKIFNRPIKLKSLL